jgi:hypothetical protein
MGGGWSPPTSIPLMDEATEGEGRSRSDLSTPNRNGASRHKATSVRLNLNQQARSRVPPTAQKVTAPIGTTIDRYYSDFSYPTSAQQSTKIRESHTTDDMLALVTREGVKHC